MFDFLRNLGRSEEELEQDAMNAYLDRALTPAERERFEQQLARDSDLQEQLAEMQFWQQQMRALPARRVPRNFTLDPALYGRPQRQPMAGAYPMLRTATALTAFLFVIALAANVYLGGVATQMAPQADSVALMQPAEEESLTEESAKIEMETAVEAEAETFAAEEQPAMEQAAAVEEIAVDEAVAGAEAGSAEAAAAPVEAEVADTNAQIQGEMPPGLLSMQGTSQPPPDVGGGGGGPPLEAAPAPAEELAAEAAPILETAVPEERSMASPATTTAAELPEAADEGVPQSTPLLPGGFTPFLIALGVLFIVLLVLTLLARPRL